jgi:hypothetical protein
VLLLEFRFLLVTGQGAIGFVAAEDFFISHVDLHVPPLGLAPLAAAFVNYILTDYSFNSRFNLYELLILLTSVTYFYYHYLYI